MFCKRFWNDYGSPVAMSLLILVGLASMTGCPAESDPNFEWIFDEGTLVTHATSSDTVMVISHRGHSDGVVYCTWVDSAGEKHKEDFRETELRAVTENHDVKD